MASEHPPAVDRSVHVVPLSAPDAAGLRRLAERVAAHAAQHDEPVADVAHTLGTRDAPGPMRLAVTCATREQLAAALGAWLGGKRDAKVEAGPEGGVTAPPRVGLLFTGQGSQHVGMGRQLHGTSPTFAEALDGCAALFDARLDRPLRAVIFGVDGAESPIDETTYTQPSLFAVEHALYRLWHAWGLRPAALLGHSIGEVAAACAAGVLSVADAAVLVSERGRRMGALPAGGAMASVRASAEVVEGLIEGAAGVDVAAYNGPDQVVLSGAREALDVALERARAAELSVTELRVSHAFHSVQMEPMLAGFEAAIANLTLSPPDGTLISNVSGAVAGEEVAVAAYWARHVRAPVRFAQGMGALLDAGVDALLEIGPQPVLLTLGRKVATERGGKVPEHWLPSLRRGRDDWSVLAKSVATLFAQGVDIDFAAFDAPYARRRIDALA